MNLCTHVINLTRSKVKLKELLSWCEENFGPVSLVHYPAMAELHRVSYDDKVNNIVVFYFREEVDYFFFLLRWQ